MSTTPILFIVFNRPVPTALVFDAIRKSAPAKLYIAADAPRNDVFEDEIRCREVREIAEGIDWPCEVKRLYQTTNLGCSLGPRTAFNWFFAQEKEGIILEDDCIPHSSFFLFAETMLEKFRDNKNILSINGSNLGYRLNNGDSYTFSRFMNMWGWATWADRANSIDYSLKEWTKIKHPSLYLYSKLRQNLFDFDIQWYKYWQHKFDLTVSGKEVTWWDWQWIWHQTFQKQLSVVPAVNLVSNIGFHEDGTHTKSSDNPAAAVKVHAMNFPIKHPLKITPDFIYEERFVKWIWCYHKRQSSIMNLRKWFKSLVSKLSPGTQ